MANPQVNSILEIIHQVKANLVSKFYLQYNYLEEHGPWSGILAAASFVEKITYNTMLQATPGQMVFGHDMFLNTPFILDWEDIRRRNPKLIDKNIQLEN